MLLRKKRHTVPGLNTSSTADISFMLLILFLVTTSIDSNNGIARRLLAIDKSQQKLPETAVNQKHIIQFEVKKGGIVLLDKHNVDLNSIKSKVQAFIEANGKQHYIQLKTDRDATYDTYFQIQNAIVSAYQAVKDKQALASFGKVYELCSPDQQLDIDQKVPERLSEVYVLASNDSQLEDDKQAGSNQEGR